MSWFPLIILAFLVGNTIAGTFVIHTSHPTPAQFQVFTFYTDLVMLIISGVFCFLIVPMAFKVGTGNYRYYLEDIEILGGTWRAVVACIGLLALLAVFIPLLVPSGSWHVDVPAWLTLAQPPLVEETLFRGLVLALLLKRFPAWVAVL